MTNRARLPRRALAKRSPDVELEVGADAVEQQHGRTLSEPRSGMSAGIPLRAQNRLHRLFEKTTQRGSLSDMPAFRNSALAYEQPDKHPSVVAGTILARRRSSRAEFRAAGDFGPLPARKVRSCVLQPLLNSHEARFNPRSKMEAAAARQRNHPLIGP